MLKCNPVKLGIKMNQSSLKNNNTILRQNISFGTSSDSEDSDSDLDINPFKGLLKIADKVANKIAGGVGKFTAKAEETVKEVLDSPSTPREIEARKIVDKYTTKTAGTATTIGQIPMADAIFIKKDQEKMLREIATKAYHLDENKKTTHHIADNCAEVGIRAAATTEEIIKSEISETLSNLPHIGIISKGVIAASVTKIAGEKFIKKCKKLSNR